ncbi:hypothetical protein SODALDRAFT_347192 [Sodiomyces alkalinus F11]|uniref:Proteasome assembly chaperone 3 n=1 Tax=Sodiomyces alkalinus (strain CBS 110278 / VKM F-3762 / F11) TaxID=1314773 RepID=A0A3N2Q5W4_SODAK|nr:hypothetical protein SODALDRAFT_347192 [Sodiomyces alkalinus F11]ROT42130.1 hypothetical protein SODALDRAFT_347192 [Sodiomyces alkalinus F11]
MDATVSEVREEPFPAKTKQATGTINGVETEATSMFFSDRIVVTISQEGRLSQWIQVPLLANASAMVDMNLPTSRQGMLPSTHLTPKTLLGGGGEDRETLGQLYAAQVGSLITLRNSDDRRTLVLGLGLLKVDTSREAFFDTVELVQKVL